jgi:DNA-binding winged helix-turn-helix (wHTH) protein
MDLAFADCILNTSARQLIRGGVVVPLQPKNYSLLELLIERRPAVVTYSEIDERLWPKVYVTRTSVTRLISELRTALGDSAGDGTIIRTAYKTGYAFAANVSLLQPSPAPRMAFALLWGNRWLNLAEGENVAGRGPECAVVIDALSVSRRHARFTVSAGVVTLEDLGSTNGTYVNNIAISAPTLLKDRDEVGMGKATLTIRSFDPAAPTEVTRIGCVPS